MVLGRVAAVEQDAACSGPVPLSSVSQSLHAGAAYVGSGAPAPAHAIPKPPVTAPPPAAAESAAIPAPSAATPFGDSPSPPGAAQAASSADNFRSKYLMALQVPAPHWHGGDEAAEGSFNSRRNSFNLGSFHQQPRSETRGRSTSDDSNSRGGPPSGGPSSIIRRAYSGVEPVFADMEDELEEAPPAWRGSRGSRGSFGDPSASVLALAHLTEEPEVYRLTEEEGDESEGSSQVAAPPLNGTQGDAAARSNRRVRDRAEMESPSKRELAAKSWEQSRSL